MPQPAAPHAAPPKAASRPPVRRGRKPASERSGGDNLHWGALKGMLGFQMRQAQAALYRDFSATLRHLDLTQRQYAALALVEHNPGVSQIAISNALDMDRATVMAIIRRLEVRGCIERKRAGDDRRRQELALSEAGRALTAEARKAIAAHEGHFSARFTQEELTAFKRMLSRISQA